MIDNRHRDDGGAARMPFVAALWLMIAIALLSALAPLGPPLSRATGSAFNPATSDVVTQARAPLAAQTAQAVRPDGDGPQVTPLLALAFLILAGWRVLAMPVGRTARVAIRPATRPSIALARAPPALS